MAEIVIPPIPALADPHTAAHEECYWNRVNQFLKSVGQCIVDGGGAAVIQACVNAKHDDLEAQLQICEQL